MNSDNPKCYKTFIRNWWRKEQPGNRLVPNIGARGQTRARNLTYDEARRMCEDYNASHEPGQLSRKMEFTVQ